MYTKISAAFVIFILFILSFNSCKRERFEYIVPDFGYFPLDSGTYSIYQVNYVLYNDFERTIDSSEYLLKEIVGKIETDNLGNPYQRIERYTKHPDSTNWKFVQVWAAQLHDNKAFRIEDNQRYICISFPASPDKEWDGLVYIRKDTTIAIPGGTIDQYKDWDNFRIISADISETIGSITYDSVMTVLRADKINNIERRYSIEKYAKNIGLVMRKDSILDTQCGGNIASCINTPWAEKAEKGFILNMTLIESNR